MRLSLYTDLALRTLMYLAGQTNAKPVSTSIIAHKYGVSHFHLQKAVQGLRKLGYVTSLSGRNGGLQLAVVASALKIGNLIAELESTGCMVDCGRGPCPLAGACMLKSALDRAERTFYSSLNEFTLADMIAGPTLKTLHRMM